jgi:acetyl-CoA synthetase (ADP-forming)
MEHESKELISQCDIPVGQFKLVTSEEEAISFAEEIGYPVVAKLMSPEILHKTDAGLVKLNIKTTEQLIDVYNSLIEKAKNINQITRIEGINIQKMVQEGVIEIIIGALRDKNFGPVIMFGLGGIFIEIFKDVTYRVCPVSENEAEKMIKEIKAFPLLNGYRNNPQGDIDEIIVTIRKCCKIMNDNPLIQEIDLNPIILFPKGKGLIAVDARIILKEEV